MGRLGGVDPVRLRAYLHSVSNVGISVGTLIAGVAIADGSRLAYQMVMIGDAGTFLGAASLLLLVPRAAAPPVPATSGRGRSNVGSVRRAGAALAGAMILYGAAAGREETVAIVALMAAAVTHTLGELLQSAGSYGISYGMAADGALGEYLGIYGLGIGLCRALAPGILAATCIEHGDAGWLGLGGLFVLSGLVTKLLVYRSEPVTDRPSYSKAAGASPP